MHARFGEVLYMASTTSGAEDRGQKYLAESVKRFCRSIELCDNYLRGYCGLKLVCIAKSSEKHERHAANLPQASDKFLADIKTTKPPKNSEEDLEMPEKATVEALNQKATEKLAEIVRRYTAKEAQWQGYEASDIAAARELLGEAAADVIR
jgi:ER membrane protein complex subunit 2